MDSQEQYAILIAYEKEIKTDVYDILNRFPQDVVYLLEQMKKGNIDGNTYTKSKLAWGNECSVCLIGSLVAHNVRKRLSLSELSSVAVRVGRKLNSHSPAERWFSYIEHEDTCEDNPFLARATIWVEEWLGNH